MAGIKAYAFAAVNVMIAKASNMRMGKAKALVVSASRKALKKDKEKFLMILRMVGE